MSIVTRIFMLIAVTLLLVAGGELFNGLKLRQNRLGEVRTDTMQLARIAELDMVRILEGTHQLLATLAKLPIDHGWDERACSVVSATASSDFEYDHIVAVDRSGTRQCSSTLFKRSGTPMSDRELFDRIVATGGFSVGSYGIGEVSGNEVIRVGYPVVDDTGTVVGAVYAGINVTWLNTAISEWHLGATASIDITDRNGILIARHPDPQAVGQPIADNLRPFLSAAGVGAAEVTGAEGAVRLYGYVPVKAGPSDGLAVFVGRDQLQLVADINRSIWLNGAVVLFGLLLSAIF
ncbi:MAG TPA: cache domain-containing protein, partial [Xanthobacteraceae bacterium]|nr:cache domain-containing protein [Xanthobacteraceae bacterium]